MAKRKITPYKGGRYLVAPTARLTKEEYDLLSFVLVNRGVSFADWLVEKSKEDQDLIYRVAAITKLKPVKDVKKHKPSKGKESGE